MLLSKGRNCMKFQSTLPAWGATAQRTIFAQNASISIHAPRVGSDYSIRSSWAISRFQSTLPAWGATFRIRAVRLVDPISIHAPRVGSDARQIFRRRLYINFNPRSPRGERQQNRTNTWDDLFCFCTFLS